MTDLIDTLRAARRDAATDAERLAAIAAQSTGLDADAVQRVRMRIEQRAAVRDGYIAQLVAQLRDVARRTRSDVEALQQSIDAEKTTVDELRLLRRVGEITQAEAEPRIAEARAAVQAARDRLALLRDLLQRAEAELAHFPEPEPEAITQ